MSALPAGPPSPRPAAPPPATVVMIPDGETLRMRWPPGCGAQAMHPSAGNLFIADGCIACAPQPGGHRIRKVSPSGIITTVAGGGAAGLGDGGPAGSADISHPAGVAVDGQGN